MYYSEDLAPVGRFIWAGSLMFLCSGRVPSPGTMKTSPRAALHWLINVRILLLLFFVDFLLPKCYFNCLYVVHVNYRNTLNVNLEKRFF